LTKTKLNKSKITNDYSLFTTDIIADLEDIIQYKFTNSSLLTRALTHASFFHTKNSITLNSYERLEFFGDSILGYIVAKELYTKFPNANVGELTKAKSYIVSKNTLADVINKLGLTKYIFAGHLQSQACSSSTKVKSDIFESIICAIYLDSRDLTNCEKFVNLTLGHFYSSTLKALSNYDYKSTLLEYAKKNNMNLILSTNKNDDDSFLSKIFLNDNIIAEYTSSNKSIASQKASEIALKVLNIST
jgi:ribonuclease-3